MPATLPGPLASLALASLLTVVPAAAAPASPPLAPQIQPAAFEDYRESVGHVEGGTLGVTLEAVEVGCTPWGEDGPTVPVHAFAADGEAPRVPGPLIRVRAGTPVHVTLRNSLARPLVVRGLKDRPGSAPTDRPAPIWAPFLGDSVAVAPGGNAEVSFTPTAPGTYFYYGHALRGEDQVVPPFIFSGDREDGPFVGVLIVDPAGAGPSRTSASSS